MCTSDHVESSIYGRPREAALLPTTRASCTHRDGTSPPSPPWRHLSRPSYRALSTAEECLGGDLNIVASSLDSQIMLPTMTHFLTHNRLLPIYDIWYYTLMPHHQPRGIMNLLSFMSPRSIHCFSCSRGFHAPIASANTEEQQRKPKQSQWKVRAKHYMSFMAFMVPA